MTSDHEDILQRALRTHNEKSWLCLRGQGRCSVASYSLKPQLVSECWNLEGALGEPQTVNPGLSPVLMFCEDHFIPGLVRRNEHFILRISNGQNRSAERGYVHSWFFRSSCYFLFSRVYKVTHICKGPNTACRVPERSDQEMRAS